MILYPFPPKNNYRKDLIKTITSFCFSHYMLFRYIKESISNAKKRAKPSTSVGESTKQSVDSSAKKISSNDLSEMNTLNAILDDEIVIFYIFYRFYCFTAF